MSERPGGERRERIERERRERTERMEPHGPSVLPSGSNSGRTGRWVLPAVAVVALLAAAAVVLGFVTGRDGDTPAGGDGEGEAATSTALVTLAQDGRLTGASLVAVGPEETSALLVPSRLVVDVAGGGRVPLAEALGVSPDAAGDAVEDALDVRVDGTWLLTAAGLARLVDAVGGVAVEVAAPVQAGDVVLEPGAPQRLTGQQAAALATTLDEDEAEAGRLARQETVLAAALEALPEDRAEVEELLAGLGEESRTTFEPARLAALLADVSASVSAGSYGATVLPVDEIATGGDEVLYGVDDEAAAELLASRFADVQRAGAADAVRVLVQNGAGTPGLGDAARDRLVDAGFRFVGGGNAATLGRPSTAVLVPSGERADREVGLAVAEALGLAPDVVAVGQEAPTTADVVVVLGEDFAEVTAEGS